MFWVNFKFRNITAALNYFSSYNKQWQDAQLALVDMLAIETPAQPRAPEPVCYDCVSIL